MNESRYQRRKRKARKWVKWTMRIFAVLLVVLLTFGGYLAFQVYQAAKSSYHPVDRPGHKSKLRETAPSIGKDPISLLLMGIEDYSSDGENGRADTQIVVTLNPKTNEMLMVSLNRDWRVQFPDEVREGYHKLNSSYTYGEISGYGANKLAMETVEKLLHIPIDEYVAVDFQGFVDIVNELGGVKVNVKYPFWERNIFDNGRKIYFEKGPALLNGEEALAFVRMRKRPINVTYTRMERQRQFLKAALTQAISAGTLFKVDDIGDILGEHVETSLTPKQIYTLEKGYAKLDKIHTLEIEGEDKRIPAETGPYYFIPDPDSLEQVRDQLRKSLGLPAESEDFESSEVSTEE